MTPATPPHPGPGITLASTDSATTPAPEPPRPPACVTTTNGHPVTKPSATSGLENLPVIPKRTQLKGAQRDTFLQQILEIYDSGASIRDISEQTHRAYGSIQALLRGAGVLRGRGGDQHQRRPRASSS
ncbi:helix-turn-helix domain-containing protein [Streptomyces microflavus]|uniref:helix-turn-helix domain-containing protein n=1 Tax=Streptomyces microflavus TaxID=1919 RepID=UPI003647DF75